MTRPEDLAYLIFHIQAFLIVEDTLTNDQFYYLYRLADGNRIDVKIDGNLLFVNGMVRSINLTGMEGANFSDWFDSARPDALQAVRTIVISGGFDEYKILVMANEDCSY